MRVSEAPRRLTCIVAALLIVAAMCQSAPAPTRLSILARRVDESHPYFYKVTIDLSPRSTSALSALKNSLSEQMGGRIRRLVKNDQQMLISDNDVADLQPSDRVEVWLLSSGLPTRAITLNAHARFGKEGLRWRLEALRAVAERQKMQATVCPTLLPRSMP